MTDTCGCTILACVQKFRCAFYLQKRADLLQCLLGFENHVVAWHVQNRIFLLNPLPNFLQFHVCPHLFSLVCSLHLFSASWTKEFVMMWNRVMSIQAFNHDDGIMMIITMTSKISQATKIILTAFPVSNLAPNLRRAIVAILSNGFRKTTEDCYCRRFYCARPPQKETLAFIFPLKRPCHCPGMWYFRSFFLLPAVESRRDFNISSWRQPAVSGPFFYLFPVLWNVVFVWHDHLGVGIQHGAHYGVPTPRMTSEHDKGLHVTKRVLGFGGS